MVAERVRSGASSAQVIENIMEGKDRNSSSLAEAEIQSLGTIGFVMAERGGFEGEVDFWNVQVADSTLPRMP